MIDSIISLTKQFISIPSISGETEPIMEILKLAQKQLKKFPFRAFESNGHPSLLYTNTTKDETIFDLILNAHLDVVPAETNQFFPYEKNGKLYGRGAYDMKAASAVIILLFQELAHQLPYKLGLQLVTDEEPGGYHGTRYQVQNGIRSKFVICGEGTSLQIVNKAKARLLLKLTSTGIAEHSGYPWKGKNAIWHMHQAIARIFEEYPIPTQETDKTLVNVTSITTSNSAYNRIPADCTAYLDIRFVASDKDTILEKILSLLPKDITHEVIFKFTPHDTSPENHYLQLIQKIGKEITKKDITLYTAHASSDQSFFAEVGIEGIELGPVGGSHHSENEWVDIQSIKDYYHILKKFLLSFT